MQIEKSPLGNLKSRLVLAAYTEPLTPSEVARRLRLPANTVHYWTGRLVETGYLEEVEARGRSRVFRAIVRSESVDLESVGRFAANLMSSAGKLVSSAVERWNLNGEAPPVVDVHELQMRAADVPKVVEAIRSLIENWSDEESENTGKEVYTLMFVAAPGRLSEE